MLPKSDSLHIKKHSQTKSESMKKVLCANRNKKIAGVVTLISDKINLKQDHKK